MLDVTLDTSSDSVLGVSIQPPSGGSTISDCNATLTPLPLSSIPASSATVASDASTSHLNSCELSLTQPPLTLVSTASKMTVSPLNAPLSSSTSPKEASTCKYNVFHSFDISILFCQWLRNLSC